MQKYLLKQDLRLFYTRATSFPAGIKEAFTTLEKKLPSLMGRVFYGISHMENGVIVYKAAVLETEKGEGEKYGCETLTLKKGEYITETLMKWKEKTELIAGIFQKLLSDPRLDTSSACVEWYKSDEELMCMVRIIQE
jgi:hypothetical protein